MLTHVTEDKERKFEVIKEINEEGKEKERDVKEKEMKSSNRKNKNEEGVCMQCVHVCVSCYNRNLALYI